MFGMNDFPMDQATGKLEETLNVVRQINAQFKDPASIRHTYSTPMTIITASTCRT